MSLTTNTITPDAKIEAISNAMGFDQPSGLELVAGQHFANDDALLDAATKAELEREDPRYQSVRRRLAAQLQKQREQEVKAQQEKDYQAALASVKLNSYELEQIDKEAADRARADLANSRISASYLGKQIEKYAKELTEKKRQQKAISTTFNAQLRQMWRGN